MNGATSLDNVEYLNKLVKSPENKSKELAEEPNQAKNA